MQSLLNQLKNRKFSLPYMRGKFEIKPLMSGFVLEKGGHYYGTIIPWHCTKKQIHVMFTYFGRSIEETIEMSDIEFN